MNEFVSQKNCIQLHKSFSKGYNGISNNNILIPKRIHQKIVRNLDKK